MSRRHIVMQLLVTQQKTQAWRALEDCRAVERLLTTIVALREWSAERLGLRWARARGAN